MGLRSRSVERDRFRFYGSGITVHGLRFAVDSFKKDFLDVKVPANPEP